MASAVALQPSTAPRRLQTAIPHSRTPAAAARWSTAAPAARRPPAQPDARPQRRQQRNDRRVAARALDTVVEGMAVAEFQELMAAEPAVLVDFYTTWCGPGKVLDVALKVCTCTWAPNTCCCFSCSR